MAAKNETAFPVPSPENVTSQEIGELIGLLDFLSPAHIIFSTPEELVLRTLRFKAIEEEKMSPINDACLLRYDIKNSEKVFKGSYDSYVNAFHSAAEKVAYHYGFVWKGKEGDRNLLLSDPDLNQSPKQTFINAYCCALDMQQLLENPQGVKDYLFGSNYSGGEFENLSAVLAPLPLEKRKLLALKLGITSLSQVTFASGLSEIKAVQDEEAQSIIELERVLNLPGSFLLRNQQTEKLLKKMNLNPDDQLICLDPSYGIYLVRLDRIPGEKYELPGWQLLRDPDFKPEELRQFNENVVQVKDTSGHNHVEGSFPAERDNSPESRMIRALKFVTFPELLRQLNTWRIQMAMALAFEKPTLPEEFRDIVDKVIQEKFAGEQVINQDKAMMAVAVEVGRQVAQTLGAKSGKVLVSPFNAAWANSLGPSFSTLTEEHLPPRVRENLKNNRLPEGFQPLNFKKYLTALKEGLGPLEIVVSLRRDDIERDILTYFDKTKTDAFIQELKELKQAGIIAEVDICGDETALSVEEMKQFIKKLKDNNLPCSLHAGEMIPENTAQGLVNILDALKLKVRAIGHAFSLWYLLAADENNPILLRQKEKIEEIATRLELATNASYQEIALKIIEKLIDQKIVIQVCPASNLCICLKNDSEPASLYQRFLLHPLIEALAKYSDEIELPQMQLGFDDCVATQLSPEEEVQAFIYALLEKGCSLTQIHELMKKYFMASLK